MTWPYVIGLVAVIITGLAWACCIVGSDADGSFDAAQARANISWEEGWPETLRQSDEQRGDV